MEILCMSGMFLYLSAEDIKRKTVPVIPMMIWGMVGIVLHIAMGRINDMQMLLGMIPGVAAYILSILTKEKIGRGDALLLVVTGIYMGFWGNIIMLWVGLIFAAIGGVAAIVIFKKKKSDELPFIPFLAAAYVMYIISNGGMPGSSGVF